MLLLLRTSCRVEIPKNQKKKQEWKIKMEKATTTIRIENETKKKLDSLKREFEFQENRDLSISEFIEILINHYKSCATKNQS